MKRKLIGIIILTMITFSLVSSSFAQKRQGGFSIDILKKHELFLYPIVRVFAGTAAGSGVLIYSKEDPNNKNEFISLVLTCHHVIEGLIKYKKDWDSVIKKNVEKEFLEKGSIEIFEYVRMSKVDSTKRYAADIVAYDKNHDLAILRINSPKKFDYLSKLIPKDDIKDLKLFTDVVVSGCSLAHEPFCNFGQITFLNEIIEQKTFLMSNANSIFGNSGGALFLSENGQLIGITARITGIQLGFGFDIMTWMGFSIHPERIYEFIDEQELRFIYDEKDTFKSAMDRREKKKQEALMSLKAEFIKEQEIK